MRQIVCRSCIVDRLLVSPRNDSEDPMPLLGRNDDDHTNVSAHPEIHRPSLKYKTISDDLCLFSLYIPYNCDPF